MIYKNFEQRKRAAWKRYIAYFISKQIPKAKMTQDPEGRLFIHITTADAIRRLIDIEGKRTIRWMKIKTLTGHWPKNSFMVKVDPV